MVLLRRRLQAFYNCEVDDLREIVSTIVANRIIGSTLQHQSVWIVRTCSSRLLFSPCIVLLFAGTRASLAQHTVKLA